MWKVNLKIFVAVCVFMMVLTGQAADGATITVANDGGPADFTSIQPAIDYADNGDEIEVRPGTYNEAINFNGKAVRLYSSGGPDVTTIDGTGNYHVVQCVNGEDANTILEGFTITGGDANGIDARNQGGGMYNRDSSPKVTNCIFQGNSAGYGGGMLNDSSSPTITDCNFIDNTATDFGGGMENYNGGSPTVTNCLFSINTAEDGGGMMNNSCSPTVTNCTFIDNHVTSDGGGMYNYDNSSPTITDCNFSGNTAAEFGAGMANYSNSEPNMVDCTFTSNVANDNGGGMWNHTSSPSVTNCTFSNNTTNTWGGAIYNYSSGPAVTDCTFSGNSAGYGGGLFNYSSSPIVANCIFTGNSAESHGGGMENHEGSSPTVTNCTFTGNTATNYGGGMFNDAGTSTTVANCLFSANEANRGGGMLNNYSDPTVTNCTFVANTSLAGDGGGIKNHYSNPVVTNCIVWDNTGGEIIDFESSPTVTYCDVKGGYSGTGNIDADPLFVDADNNDLRLRACSLCVDAGNNAAVPAGVTTDLGGNPRFVDDEGVADTGAGTAPIVDMGAYERQMNTQIWPDIYNITKDENYCSIQMAIDNADDYDEIEVGTGRYYETIDFKGKAITLRSSEPNDPNIVADTIIDGTGYYHVVQCISGEGPNTILEGFTITGGNANGTGSNRRGGGMYNNGSSPTISNCTFRGNNAVLGGGMWNLTSGPTVTSCTFSDNHVTGNGGGMYNYDNSSPTVTDCNFSYNVAGEFGAGMANYSNSKPNVIDCTFTGNGANDNGGGMWNHTSSPTVINCTFSSNRIKTWGGAIYNYSSGPTVTDCNFSNNLASYGGGLFNYASSPIVANCIFTGNKVKGHGGGMENYENSSPMVANCTFTQNTAEEWGGGIFNNVGTNPTVTNCLFTGNEANRGGGMLNDGSDPTITNCTFVANTSLAGDGGGIKNHYSNPVVTNCIVWANTGGEIIDVGSSPVVSYCDVQGGYSGTGNIGVNPLFVNALNGNLRLGAGSPCVDAGNNAAEPAGVTTDIGGNPRFVDDANVPDTGAGTAPIVDMGVYERQTDSVPLVNNAGMRYWTISEAMDEAGDGDVIEVSPGTFGEVIDFNGVAITLRSTDPNDPEVVAATIIDATGLGSSAVICASGEGPNTILEGFTITGGTGTLDEYTQLCGGGMRNENSSPTVTNCIFTSNSAEFGGGMFCENSSPTVSNCTFIYNTADCNGGGMYNRQSSPAVIGCLFYRNSTSDGEDYKYPRSEPHGWHGGHAGHGAGIYNDNSSPIVSYCDFIENRTGSGGKGERGTDGGWYEKGGWGGYGGNGGHGAVMYNYFSSPIVTDCLFRLNETGAGGAAGDGGKGGDGELFYGDDGGDGGVGGDGGDGAGMYNDNSSPMVSYCDFTENRAGTGGKGGDGGDGGDGDIRDGEGGHGDNGGDGGGGGGMYNYFSAAKVTGCSFGGNETGAGGNGGDGGEGVPDGNGGDGGDGGDGAGVYNSDSDPNVTNCTFTANATGEGGLSGSGSPDGSWGSGGVGAGISGYNSSPTVSNCILWADEPDEIFDDATSSSTVTYSDVQGGWGDPNDPGNSNIDADPCFVDAAGGNLRLLSVSPCIDAGDNYSVPADTNDLDGDGNTVEPIPFDLEGHPRILDGDCDEVDVVDMGAHEFSYAYIGDLDYNCRLDLVDFAVLALAWMTEPGDAAWDPFCDISSPADDYIDWRDVAMVCENWLSEFRMNFYDFSLDSNPGWTTEGQWAFGQPTGSGGSGGGYPDPTSGYTGTNVYGVNLNGDYTVAVGGPYRLTTGPLDCSEYRRVELKFARWLNSDEPDYVSSKVEVSNNASDWYTIWEHTGVSAITDDSWRRVQYDIGSVADGQSTVYIRWSYEIVDGHTLAYSGWNIDDIQISGISE